jgi:hypothetical protein
MRLSERDRKLLWGRAANRCAMCKRELVIEATTTDRESIIGDEAHIIADSERGPRGESGSRTILDTYANAILLCKVDHRRVDDQPLKYTADQLRRLKAAHESWVRTTLSAGDRAKAERALGEIIEGQSCSGSPYTAMTRFGPSEWCPPANANGPEVVLRFVAAVPEPLSLVIGRQPSPPVTRLRAEAREELIVHVLDNSTLTERIRGTSPSWHWAAASGWRPLGGSENPDLTRFELKLDWPQHRIRQPLGVSAAILTGTTGNGGPHGLILAVDISLNVQELDANRQPSDVAYRTTPPPAPAALSLRELANLKRTLLMAADLTPDLSEGLLGQRLEQGQVGLWLMLNAVTLERVIRLDGVRRLEGALSISRFDRYAPWPLRASPGEGDPLGDFVEDFLNDLLEAADFRGFREVVAREVS